MAVNYNGINVDGASAANNRVYANANLGIIANGDSPVTDVLWTHYYQPNKIGRDTVWHGAKYPSQLILPVHE